jgi:hypothetical protein
VGDLLVDKYDFEQIQEAEFVQQKVFVQFLWVFQKHLHLIQLDESYLIQLDESELLSFGKKKNNQYTVEIIE